MRREITPQPGYLLSDCDALLATRQFVRADCFTITPLQGAVVRLTNAQEDISIVGWADTNRFTYSARQAVIMGLRGRHSSSSTSAQQSLQVDEQQILIGYADDALFQNWKPWPQALLQGWLDGASIARDIAFGPEFGQWYGVTRLFYGVDPELDSVGRSLATLRINSGLGRLNRDVPRDPYMIKCRNVFGDARCGIDLNSIAVLGTVGASPTTTKIPWASANSSYAAGKIHITNGDSVTRVRTIQKADSSNLYLTYPLDFLPSAGMQFTAFPGCSHLSTGANGCSTYWGSSWQQHFGGCPFIPVAESAF